MAKWYRTALKMRRSQVRSLVDRTRVAEKKKPRLPAPERAAGLWPRGGLGVDEGRQLKRSRCPLPSYSTWLPPPCRDPRHHPAAARHNSAWPPGQVASRQALGADAVSAAQAQRRWGRRKHVDGEGGAGGGAISNKPGLPRQVGGGVLGRRPCSAGGPAATRLGDTSTREGVTAPHLPAARGLSAGAPWKGPGPALRRS